MKYYHYTYDDTWEWDRWSGAWEDSHFSIATDLTNCLAFGPGPVPASGLLLGKCNVGQLITGVDAAGDAYGSSMNWTELDFLFPDQRGMMACITLSNYPPGTVTSRWATATLSAPYEIWEEHTPYFTGFDTGLVAGQRDKIERLQIKLRTGGKRCVTNPTSALTGKRAASGAPQPELAQANHARMAWFQEPDDDDNMRNGTIKEFTGNINNSLEISTIKVAQWNLLILLLCV